ncbi:MAG: LytR C-terminal domain-containing protein [Actinomycetota bacterium]|nr:LytR C-terminal domain-containing protein [Actinomycetota bacterium]
MRSGAPTRITATPASVIPPPRRRSWYQGLLANPLYAVLAVAGVLILGAAAIFGVTQLTGGGDGSSPAGQDSGGAGNQTAQGGEEGDAEQNGATKQRKGGAVKPGNVTVAVLNGTTVPGLATTLADQVTAAGFKPGTVANFLNQGLAESVVQYTPGHEREAAAVSRKVGIGQREAATAESRELAGDATVIVIAGGDKAP